jgi:hypothetical protein
MRIKTWTQPYTPEKPVDYMDPALLPQPSKTALLAQQTNHMELNNRMLDYWFEYFDQPEHFLAQIIMFLTIEQHHIFNQVNFELPEIINSIITSSDDQTDFLHKMKDTFSKADDFFEFDFKKSKKPVATQSTFYCLAISFSRERFAANNLKKKILKTQAIDLILYTHQRCFCHSSDPTILPLKIS